MREDESEHYFRLAFEGTARKSLVIRQIYDFLAFSGDVGGLYGTLVLLGFFYNFLFNQ